MEYTIGQVAKMMGISTFTLRYYDKEGLLPFVKRTANGVRVFEESDLAFLHVINCLKHTGMPIHDIRNYIVWAEEGDASLQKRYDLFQKQRHKIDRQIKQLMEYRKCIDFKCRYYQEALKAGTEAIHFGPDTKEEEMPLKMIIKLDKEETE